MVVASIETNNNVDNVSGSQSNIELDDSKTDKGVNPDKLTKADENNDELTEESSGLDNCVVALTDVKLNFSGLKGKDDLALDNGYRLPSNDNYSHVNESLLVPLPGGRDNCEQEECQTDAEKLALLQKAI